MNRENCKQKIKWSVKQRTRALGDVSTGAAGGGQRESSSHVDLDGELGVVVQLDKDAEALGLVGEDCFEASAAVRRGSLGGPLDEGDARLHRDQVAAALRHVARDVGARGGDQQAQG
ncbi:hypothetical protein B296_00043715 [Ensete ventricosum]|uniref:Uncharacterized protein n=1 Tax=Ensete ventricosum TaxID=4639 RepID=A0A426YH81_ENSVE|nr:hypothetical protein B296_00043715 [Ensete ventricosum]